MAARTEGATEPVTLRVVNLLVLVAVLWLNALAGAGTLSGESIGLVANRYPSYFLPANYVFGIWSLIYLWLTAFSVYQVLPAQRGSAPVQRIGFGWAVNGALNVSWIVLFSFSLFGPSLLVMVGLIINLVWIGERIGWHRGRLGRGDRFFVAYPFALYLAWISVALIANTFQFVTYLEWGGLGISGQVWSAIMMVVATCLGLLMTLHRGNWFFPLVFAWAFAGIANRFDSILLISNTAWTATSLGLVGMVLGLIGRRRSRQGSP